MQIWNARLNNCLDWHEAHDRISCLGDNYLSTGSHKRDQFGQSRVWLG